MVTVRDYKLSSCHGFLWEALHSVDRLSAFKMFNSVLSKNSDFFGVTKTNAAWIKLAGICCFVLRWDQSCAEAAHKNFENSHFYWALKISFRWNFLTLFYKARSKVGILVKL